jgi:iron complex outermembrane receptor protein
MGPGAVARAEDGAPSEAAAAEEPLEVLVTGDPLPLARPRIDPQVSGTVLEGDRLQQPGLTAAEALREAPGVQIVSSGGFGAPATASIRGATAQQTPVYLAGIRLNDEVGGAANLANVPLFLIERIEVYRSHAPLVASELGIGGAIFFEPRRPGTTAFGMGALLGSYGARAGHGLVAAGARGQGVVAAFQVAAAENDYPFFDDSGTLFVDDDRMARLSNADAETRDFWLMTRHAVDRAYVDVVCNQSDREQGAPRLALLPAREARSSYERQLVAARSVVPVDEWQGAIEASTSFIAARTKLDDPLGELGLLAESTETPGERVEQVLGLTQRWESGLVMKERVSVSVDRLRRHETHQGERAAALSAERLGSRAALAAALPLGRGVTVDALASGTCSDVATSELELCTSLAPEGRVGTSFEHDDSQLYANVGRYTRAPTLGELFGTSLLVRGNPLLGSEAGTTAELGGRWQHRRGARRLVWADAAAFARFSTDLVSYVRTAQGYLVPRNSDTARTLGSELLVGVSPVRPVELSASVSLLDPRETSPDRQTSNDLLPFQSRLTTRGMATFRQGFDFAWLSEAALSIRYHHQSSRFADPAGLAVIPGQHSFDVEASTLHLDRQVDVRFRIANALDTRRYDVVGFPLPGRSYFWSTEVTW